MRSSPSLMRSSLTRLTTTTTTTTKSSSSIIRLFTTTRAQAKLVQPQSRTATSDHNINIPRSTSTPVAAMSTPISATSVLDLIKQRRTYYALTKDLGSVSTDRIQEITKEAVQHVPTSFNSQTNRVLVLFGAEHDKLWDIAISVLKAIVPEDKFPSTEARLSGFKAGAGTILFFEDQEVVKGLEAKMPMYADRFGPWAVQADGMLQMVLWTALEAEGLGANLQHYNPLIDEKVQESWGVPATWKLNAQLVFGGRGGEAGPKEFAPIEGKFKVAGA